MLGMTSLFSMQLLCAYLLWMATITPAAPCRVTRAGDGVPWLAAALVMLLAWKVYRGSSRRMVLMSCMPEISFVSVMVLSYVAQSARGTIAQVIPQSEIDKAHTVVERMMIRWRGEPDPVHVRAIDAYFVSAAEHGMNASTFTGRVIASTGADVAASISGAIGAMSGPLHGGAPARVLSMIEAVEKSGNAESYVKSILDKGERLMGFGHRVYRAEDPRARTLRRTAKELNAPRYEVALALEKAALSELKQRQPDRVLETNVEFWAAIVLDFAQVPANLFTSMFTAARTAGWSAHILEQKRTGRIIRPSARYVGPGPRKPQDVKGWDASVESLHN
jgi:citrate synthase